MAFELPDLPFPADALAPQISAETLEFLVQDASNRRLNVRRAGVVQAIYLRHSLLRGAGVKLGNYLFAQAQMLRRAAHQQAVGPVVHGDRKVLEMIPG